MKHFVVTIGREYGSLGLAIGKKLAELLGVEYYDRDLMEIPAGELDLDVADVKQIDESHEGISGYFKFSKLNEMRKLDQLIDVQSKLIMEKAEKESCVIIGRCADYVLKDREDCLNVFIYAPFSARMQRIYDRHCEEGNITESVIQGKGYAAISKDIEMEIKKVDSERQNYYKYVTGTNRDEKHGKHIIIDSSVLGIDGTALLLKQMVEQKFADEV